MGGVFDLNDNWLNPHKTHRAGEDADLNKQPGNSSSPIPCSEDNYLHSAAINKLAAVSARRPSAVLCESNNRDSKHLDLTEILP